MRVGQSDRELEKLKHWEFQSNTELEDFGMLIINLLGVLSSHHLKFLLPRTWSCPVDNPCEDDHYNECERT